MFMVLRLIATADHSFPVLPGVRNAV
jgi:hypothetical protein